MVEPLPSTICNPLPIPDYPRGRMSIQGRDTEFGWLTADRRDFRELADPTVLYHGGRWYLYPSCGMAWVSDDFRTWTHHPMNLTDIGYAPTVAAHRGRFLLTACDADIYVSEGPLGPFSSIGRILDPQGRPVEAFNDPMLFSDDDGRLYAYWGLGPPGIFAAEVDPVACNRLLTEPKMVLAYDPRVVWERYGEYHEDPSRSYVEGPWMVKFGSTYYLTYAAPGTEWRTYGMGAAKGLAPLGPFVRQADRPFCAKTDGLIQGPGHGSIVAGPRGTAWVFYTCRVCVEHIFERRIGMDPCGIDAAGNLVVQVSETPQWTPGTIPDPQLGNLVGTCPVNHRRRASVSSSAPGRDPLYAIDNGMHTWWQPAAEDRQPWFLQDIGFLADVDAVRIVWRDIGLDYAAGRGPGPVRWRLDISVDGQVWDTVVDRSASTQDMLVDYQTFIRRPARHLRLSIVGWPSGIIPGVTDFSVFGYGRHPDLPAPR